MAILAINQATYVIVDIDGTIADVRHRVHHINYPGKKNWPAFFAGMDADAPIENMIEYIRKLAEEHRILVVTGRPEQYRAQTEQWLAKNSIPHETLFMRRSGDHRPDYEMKIEVLKEFPPERIVLAIDDRQPVCEMWEKRGIRCMQVQSDAGSQSVNEAYQGKPPRREGKPQRRRKHAGLSR